MLILGLNTFHADASAVAIDADTGKLIAAIAEEPHQSRQAFRGLS